ncbi:MAG: D-alanyl-D-alanine carboxypeptidase family protein [Oligoflexales bacterium]|nr:D-alanyl-D-alanine carboxypeptidase family protein [Oligoflexales bacterium]
MKRRTFLQILLSAGSAATLGGLSFSTMARKHTRPEPSLDPDVLQEDITSPLIPDNDSHIKDNLDKIRDFDRDFDDDIFISDAKFDILKATNQRLLKVKRAVGSGNFGIISYDEILKYAAYHSSIEKFTQNERELIEELFFEDASKYGFLGKKVLKGLTDLVPKKELVKIPGTGQYLFKGEANALFEKVKKDIGSTIMLTSGVRSIVKQAELFFTKVIYSRGSLSRASRSLAPPGYSYHGAGDFDVGKMGLGEFNFTEKFAETEEFRKLIQLGYLDIRYDMRNREGVRYEPWHIKVI